MKILVIMDPFAKLNLEMDTSIHLLRELARRDHDIWAADTADIWADGNKLFASSFRAEPQKMPRSLKERLELSKSSKRYKPFKFSARKKTNLKSFDMILIRKEPPFNSDYYYLTLLLEQVAGDVLVVNHPRGVRNTNEKLGILHFPKWIPKTIVTSEPQRILEFQKKLKGAIVLKPLDNKGGKDVRLFQPSKLLGSQVNLFTQNGKRLVMAQEYIATKGDKRITLLRGHFFTGYRKRFAENDFRGNFSQGATYEPIKLTKKEKLLIDDMRPYLLKEGLHLVGLDVLEGRLIDFNVTCPGGLVESTELYPEENLLTTWAESLEACRASLQDQTPPSLTEHTLSLK